MRSDVESDREQGSTVRYMRTKPCWRTHSTVIREYTINLPSLPLDPQLSIVHWELLPAVRVIECVS